MSALVLDSLRRQLREHLGIVGDSQDEIPDVDTPDKTGADTFLNRALWEVLDKYKFREKEVIGSFVTASGTSFYQIPSSFEALQGLSVEDLNTGQHIPLERISADVFEQEYVNRTDAQGKPEKYFRNGGGIKLWPTPDNIYTLKIYYWFELSDLSNTSPTPPIPRVWHEIILFGGVSRAFIGVLRDFDSARNARAFQAALIKDISPVEEKEKEDSHRSGLQPLGYAAEDV